ncbi:hypothetical protein LIER_20686 [Lithospermum erythrorhizon]|uniref:Retrotransposon Copia-like N-terminal domain-containing protein n=1 Tax=Lithospermum erythrorhizon TaxID=34254 RepID=A0AAV3QQD3_LITER
MDDPLYLHSSDHLSLVLVSNLLTKHNYQTWSRAMIIAFQARDKEEIKVQYGGCVGPRLYKIRRAIYSVKQGKDYVAGFYNKIKGYWEELVCLKASLMYGDYEDHLLPNLANLAKTYGMISNVEKPKRLNVLDPLDVSAMLNNQYQPASKPQGQGFMKEDKSVYKYDYCQKKGHLRRDCLKLKGYSYWWPGVRDQKQKEKANVVQEMDTPMEYRIDEQTNSKNM